MTITEAQDQIVKEFESLEDWDEKYEHIVKLGKQLPKISEEYKTDKYKLNGCQSQVWINAKLDDGKLIIDADSDAMIVKGLIAILVKIYSGQSPSDILSNPPDFISKIGIDHHLSPTRKNGMGAMIKEIQRMAFAYKMVTGG